MLMTADDEKVTLLSLLDIVAAFDSINHLILQQRLQIAVGKESITLDWL